MPIPVRRAAICVEEFDANQMAVSKSQRTAKPAGSFLSDLACIEDTHFPRASSGLRYHPQPSSSRYSERLAARLEENARASGLTPPSLEGERWFSTEK